MLKSLIIWASVTPSLAINLVTSNLQIINHKNQLDFEPLASQVVNKSIIIDNLNEGDNQSEISPHATSQDLHIHGKHSDTHFRIFLDSGDDKSLPLSPIGKANDYKIGKGKKDAWYSHFIPGMSLDVTKYAKDKADFLKKYRAITFSYAYNYNFWNSKDGWSYKQGKNSPLITALKTYEISPSNMSRLIFEETDGSHSNNERTNLVLKQEWVGNTLKYDFYMGAYYHWKAGSTINHASFASFAGDLYSFIAIPPDENEKVVQINHLEQESEYTLDYYKSISLVNFDKDLATKAMEEKISDSTFKTTTLFAFGYYGIQEVAGTTYVCSIMFRSARLSSKDTSLILNGVKRTRTLVQIYQNEKFYFSYLNSVNKKELTSQSDISPEYFGMTLTGFIYSPFIYTI